jgi:hypothetical protein
MEIRPVRGLRRFMAEQRVNRKPRAANVWA